MDRYDVAIIGAGAAGTMAAIRAGQLKKRVALIERNDCIGKKILMTGKGRCNVTNSASIDEFMKRFGKGGEFFRTAFTKLSNEDLIDYFKDNGLELKTERQGRVFPATDNARSVTDLLKKLLSLNGVEVIYNSRATDIKHSNDGFRIICDDEKTIDASKVVLTTGGASYKVTGSTGDGFKIAKELGHTILSLRGALVPLKTKDTWVKDVQGLALKNIRVTFIAEKKKIVSEIGEMIFTHFGVSGPLVLDLSGDVVSLIEAGRDAKMYIDLKPGLTEDEMERKLLFEIKDQGAKEVRNFLKTMLPVNIIPIFMALSNVEHSRKVNQITQVERRAMLKNFKAMPLTISGALPIEEAMVTNGGVSTKEINPRTMESKLVPGLFFAGEIIDGAASSGGYNLQQAFSTGYLAGEGASNA